VKPTSLPLQGTSFVGREAELDEIVTLLRGPSCRLLTLTGPGGSGKTRLALEAAVRLQGDFADGATFVALQPVSSPAFLVPTLAEAAGLMLHGPRDAQAQLADFLAGRQMLLALDNFEHLLDGAPLVSALLAAAPGLKVLVTSREVLNLQEEWSRPVPGLAFPAGDANSAAALADYSAVRLFAERARQARSTFDLDEEAGCVASICRLVEGLPLALELAASWLRSLSCAEVTSELERNLDFLETSLRNVPERHRSMRAVFEQSWELLSPAEQDVFARLSVFHGGCTRPAATAVAGATLGTLQALVDKSLLQVTPAGRYQIHELLRQYAAEQLAADTAALAATRQRHATYFAGFLAQHESRLKGAGQHEALQAIDAELDNVRAAWRKAAGQQDRALVEQALGSLFLYYQMRSRPQEGLDAFHLAGGQVGAAGTLLPAKLRLLETWFQSAMLSDPAPTARLYEDDFGEIRPLGQDESMAMPLCLFAWAASRLEDVTPLQQFYAANLAFHRQQGNDWGTAWAAYALGTIPMMIYGEAEPEGEELVAALPYLEESLALLRALGNRWASTYVLHVAGQLLLHQERFAEAGVLFRESLQICREVGDPGGVAFALHSLGEAAAGLQEYEGSWRYLAEAIQVSYENRNEMLQWHIYELASALAVSGKPRRAVELFSFLLAHSNQEWVWAEANIPARLAALEEQLPPRAFATARQLGEQTEMAALVQLLAAEFAGTAPAPDRTHAGGTAATAAALVEPLSERELELLRLVAAGYSNREIAEQLTVTVGTVKKHLNNIFGKLHASSRTQAVARARSLGLIS
jgi:predicted ATPase/DNA-binding CsgD family transcriptional regulator